jgi:hypothetical protein
MLEEVFFDEKWASSCKNKERKQENITMFLYSLLSLHAEIYLASNINFNEEGRPCDNFVGASYMSSLTHLHGSHVRQCLSFASGSWL